MNTIFLRPIKPTKALMCDLESKGLITRLSTENALILETPPNQTVGKTIYDTSHDFGTHKLISVSVNRTELVSGIGYHPDREDFLLISTPAHSRPLYLVISYIGLQDIQNKIISRTLSSEDFILLEMRYCDPETSFFTMNPFVPHGECTAVGSNSCPVFYVTEPSIMPLISIDFSEYKLEISDV